MCAGRSGKITFAQKIFCVFIGGCLTLILLETGLHFGGWFLLRLQSSKNEKLLKQQCDYRVLCLGESTTQGQYPGFLEKKLNERNSAIRFCVFDRGVGATTTSAIGDALQGNLMYFKPDMVVAMLGVNDGWYHMPPRAVRLPGIGNSLKIVWFFKLFGLHLEYRYRELGLIVKYGLNPDVSSGTDVASELRRDISRAGTRRGPQSPEGDDTSKKNNYAAADIYVNLVKMYQTQGKHRLAIAAGREAVKADPINPRNWYSLAWLFPEGKERDDIVDAFVPLVRGAFELNPQNRRILDLYLNFADILIMTKNVPQAQAILEHVIELNPSPGSYPYILLGRCYNGQKKFSEAEAAIRRAFELRPDNVLAWYGLAMFYQEKGEEDSAELCREKARRLRGENVYGEETTANYRAIRDKVFQRKAQFVAVQYPLRSLQTLREILDNDARVIFVDNEEPFKKVLQAKNYSEYFRDMFAGDFGHCTDKGNQLIADNIANAIFEKISKSSN